VFEIHEVMSGPLAAVDSWL
jgi:hypothetical protein